MQPGSALSQLLGTLEPVLNEGVYAFASLPPGRSPEGLDPIATMREAEGLTVVVKESTALACGLPILFRAAWLTLTVASDLESIGLTAAFSTALGRAGISCNVIAGACHDHLFVPEAKGWAALEVLKALQRAQAERCGFFVPDLYP
jgi:hypothetical protein